MTDQIISAKSAFAAVKEGKHNWVKSKNISANFTWAHVFKNQSDTDVSKCPLSVFENAVKQAATMESVCAAFKRKVTVTSWYRSPAYNKAQGNAVHSQHLLGLATDFVVFGYESIAENARVQRYLASLPFMAKRGLEYTKGRWTHVDTRSAEDGAKYGYRFYP